MFHFRFLRFGLQPRLFWQTKITLCKTVFSEGNILVVLLSPCNDVNFVKWLYQIYCQVCSGTQEKWCTYYIHLWCYQELLTWLYLPSHTLAVQKTSLFFQPFTHACSCITLSSRRRPETSKAAFCYSWLLLLFVPRKQLCAILRWERQNSEADL